ncbi:hypothetical protein [Pseudenhygromyxa sp. WMMC2535]|nr:hypothetical protein [Pseudenhygromyxa sp. WMMC2535]
MATHVRRCDAANGPSLREGDGLVSEGALGCSALGELHGAA